MLRWLGLLAFLGVPPAALTVLVGWPLPTSVQQIVDWSERDAADRISSDWLINASACLLWLLWALLALAVVAELVAAAARVRLPRLRPFSTLQAFAAGLVGTTTAAGLLGGAAHGAPPAVTATVTDPRPPGPVVIPAQRAAPPIANPSSENPSDAASRQQPAEAPLLCAGHHNLVINGNRYAYVVQKDQSLWVIAKLCLGDGNKWPEIWKLNRARHFTRTGGTLTNPDMIYPGWDLYLPATAVPPPPPATPPSPQAPPGDGPDSSVTPAPSTPTAPRPSERAPDPDGVVEPVAPTSASSSPATASITPANPPSEADPPADQPKHDGGDLGVSLPGGWVTIGLAASLVSAAAMVWLRRRARYNPTAEPDPATVLTLQALPAVVSRLRRAVREQAPELLAPPPPPQPTVRDLAGADHPPLVPIGASGPQLAGLPEQPPGGLGLTGPGGADAMRAILVATLSSGSVHDPDARGHVVIPATVLADLLGGAAATDLAGAIPRLRITAGLEHALAYVEEQIIRRTRVVTDADVTDIAALHAVDPHHEPLPPITLISDIPDTAIQARLSTAMHLGHPLAISAVIAGNWPRGTTLTVATDGSTTSNQQEQPPHRLSVLDSDTTRQLLTVIREAHTGEPPTLPAETPPPEPPTTTPAAGMPAATDKRSGTLPPTPDAATRPTAPAQPSPPAETAPVAAPPQPKVRVQILGRPAIIGADGSPVPAVRRASYELLTYLAVHSHGADIADIEVAMTPDATVRRARERLSTNVANLRNRLTHASGLDPIDGDTWKPVVNPGGRYYLDPELLDIDWWGVLDAAKRASSTTDRDAQRAALDEAVDNWSGLLYDDNFEWMDAPQHTCRQLGVTIHTRLAVLITHTDPTRARELLDAACDIDPINEKTVRLAMTAHAQAGEIAAINTRLTALTAALHEIDEVVSDETHQLARRLLHQAPRQTDLPSD